MKKALVFTLISLLLISLFAVTTTARPSKGPEWKKTPTEPAPEPTGGALLFSEYFDRLDGEFANESGLLDPLGKWTVTSGRFYTYAQQGWTDSPVFRAITQKNDFTDFDLKAKMLRKNYAAQPYEGLQLFFRYKDPYNLYVVGLRNDNRIHLKKKVNGTYTTLAVASLSTRNDYWYNVRVIAKGNYLGVYVNGVRLISKYDSSFTGGKVGIRTDNIKAYFDDFDVYSY